MSQNITEFIQGTFLGTYHQISETHAYTAFALIFTGIELLGKCLDEKADFDYYNAFKPDKHFKMGLKLLGSQYENLNLYEYCRNGFAHCVRPHWRSKIVLSERRHLSGEEVDAPNLCGIKGSKKKVLFIEDFYRDFARACQLVIDQIQSGKLKHSKLTAVFLPVKEVKLDFERKKIP